MHLSLWMFSETQINTKRYPTPNREGEYSKRLLLLPFSDLIAFLLWEIAFSLLCTSIQSPRLLPITYSHIIKFPTRKGRPKINLASKKLFTASYYCFKCKERVEDWELTWTCSNNHEEEGKSEKKSTKSQIYGMHPQMKFFYLKSYQVEVLLGDKSYLPNIKI